MNDTDMPKTRSQEHEIEIDAPEEAVWRALTDADELIRWFAPAAEIEPRLGGTYKISWGEGMDGVSEIVTFDVGRHLRLEHRPMEGSPDMPSGPIAEDWHIETREGGATLRFTGQPYAADLRYRLATPAIVRSLMSVCVGQTAHATLTHFDESTHVCDVSW